MTFIEQVKYVREKLFISQVAFAREPDVSFATINRWGNGTRLPNYTVQKAFHEFCEKNNIHFEEI